ncbi:MAG TPA: hypothetical protein VF502_14875, partial [Stellaceae bacterium]
PLYIATEPFDPRRGDEWTGYVSWSGPRHVSEIVSLDSMLCPPVLSTIIDADWPHIVNENFMLEYFVDLDYLLTRAGPLAGKNLLCVFRNPQNPLHHRRFRSSSRCSATIWSTSETHVWAIARATTG